MDTGSIIYAHARAGLSSRQASCALDRHGVQISSKSIELLPEWIDGMASREVVPAKVSKRPAPTRVRRNPAEVQRHRKAVRLNAKIARRDDRGEPIDSASILEAVANEFGLSVSAVGKDGYDRLHRAKCFAALRLREQARMPREEIAKVLGYEDPAAISRMITKAKSEFGFGRQGYTPEGRAHG